MSNTKNKGMSRDVEIQAAKYFGKHVSEEKARVLMVVTLIVASHLEPVTDA